MGFFEKIMDGMEQWIIDLILPNIEKNFVNLFTGLNDRVSDVGGELALSPSQWNNAIWEAVLKVTEVAVLPVAYCILAYVLYMELHKLMVEKNNMHEVDIVDVGKCVLKMGIASFLVTNTFKILLGIFDVFTYLIQKSTGIVTIDGQISMKTIDDMIQTLSEAELGTVIEVWVTSFISSGIIHLITLFISIMLIARMIEIYMYCSIGAIPMATITAGQNINIGNNYLKSFMALALQGFFILFVLVIYSALVKEIAHTEEINKAIRETLIYAVVLGYSLMKTGGWAKSVMGAH